MNPPASPQRYFLVAFTPLFIAHFPSAFLLPDPRPRSVLCRLSWQSAAVAFISIGHCPSADKSKLGWIIPRILRVSVVGRPRTTPVWRHHDLVIYIVRYLGCIKRLKKYGGDSKSSLWNFLFMFHELQLQSNTYRSTTLSNSSNSSVSALSSSLEVDLRPASHFFRFLKRK